MFAGVDGVPQPDLSTCVREPNSFYAASQRISRVEVQDPKSGNLIPALSYCSGEVSRQVDPQILQGGAGCAVALVGDEVGRRHRGLVRERLELVQGAGGVQVVDCAHRIFVVDGSIYFVQVVRGRVGIGIRDYWERGV